jgi:hypothetical protein
LLDNDRIIADLNLYLEREVDPKRAHCHRTIFEELPPELGMARAPRTVLRKQARKPVS